MGTILTGAAAAWLAGRVSRPLSALAYAADEVARGRIAPRLPDTGPDDIRHAAKAFNEMSDRVTRTLESHRQLLSAVGHDLRTPLAAMRITAEFVEDAEVRDRLTRNLDELQSMTEAVLSAARSGPGEEKRRVDLAALIESVCDDLVELNLPVNVNIEGLRALQLPAERNPPRGAQPDRKRRPLWRMARAYRSNATDDSSSSMWTTTDRAFPANRLDEVFEPFVRLEGVAQQRNRRVGTWADAGPRSIAREHGGEIVLQNRMTEGQITGLARVNCVCRAKNRAAEAETPHPVPAEAFAT